MYFFLEEGEVVCGSCIANIPILCFSWMVYGLQIYENCKKNTENHALEYENHGSHIHAAGSMLVFRYMYVVVCPRT